MVTVFQAEVYAIFFCAGINLKKGLTGETIDIYSDCQGQLRRSAPEHAPRNWFRNANAYCLLIGSSSAAFCSLLESYLRMAQKDRKLWHGTENSALDTPNTS